MSILRYERPTLKPKALAGVAALLDLLPISSPRPFLNRRLGPLLTAAATAGLPRLAHAVPHLNFDIGLGEALLVLLVLGLLTVGLPMLIGLLVYRAMQPTRPKPRVDAGPPLLLPCVAWLCTAFVSGIVLPGLVNDRAAGAALFLLLTVGTTVGAAVLSVRIGQEEMR